MGTKLNPGKFDCHANALPDEPMFVLLGRDKHAPTLVRLWGLLRSQDGEDAAKVEESFKCAASMEQWQLGLGKRPFDDRPAIFEELLNVVTKPMDEHPEGYDDACLCGECSSYD